MANDSSFFWYVVNPFVPRRELRASFFSGSPTVVHWYATFSVTYRRFNHLGFSFELKMDRTLDNRAEIITNNVRITIVLNDALIVTMDVPNYHFSMDNRHALSFQENAVLQPQTIPHLLAINIQILLPGMIREEGIGNGIISNAADLRSLSKDLRDLFQNHRYSNMILRSVYDDPTPILVHSYMILTRWNNFESHLDDGNLFYSRELILGILEYMYTGEFPHPNWPNSVNPSYMSELLKLIDTYNLYHLHKYFVLDDSSQERIIRDPVVIKVGYCPIHFWSEPPLGAYSPPLIIESPDFECYIIFQMRSRDNNRQPWLSYFLKSERSGTYYAHVCLEVFKVNENNVFQRVCHIDDQEYTFYSYDTVQSGPILFLGCPQIFGDDNLTPNNRFYIKCYLTITNGMTVEELQSVDGGRQTIEERHADLSEDMHRLLRSRLDHDLTAICRPDGAARVLERVHKGILVSRVPNFIHGIEGYIHREFLPNSVTVRLSREALYIVIKYIYTGRMFIINRSLLGEIEEFAVVTEFEALRDLVRRIRASDRRN